MRRPQSRTSKTLPVPAPASAASGGALPSEPELPPLDDEDTVPDDEIVEVADEVATAGAPPPAAPPASGRPSSGEAGRNVSLGDLVRKKRMREVGGAAKGGGPGPKSAMPPKPRSAPSRPVRRDQATSPDEDVLSDLEPEVIDLPSPDDDLPPID